MRRAAAVLIAAASLALTQPGCERHAASQTVPGFAEKQAEKNARENARAATPEPVTLEPPRFFPEGR
jgi:hypothetical protein